MGLKNKQRAATNLDVEKSAERLFAQLGFDVQRIATSQVQRTADLLVVKGGERYTVEVTTKSDSGDYDAALDAGDMAESERVEQHNSVVQRVLRGKKQQVRATGTGGFGVLWVETVGTFREQIAEEVIATFYGRVSIPVRSVEGRNVEKYCFFFDKAECFSHPELNAVIVSHDGALRVLLNPHAHRADEFRKSELATALCDGVTDPHVEIAEGRAFTLEDYVGERAPTAVNDRPRRAFLEKKYALALAIAVRWKKVTIATRVGLDELAADLAKARGDASETGESSKAPD